MAKQTLFISSVQGEFQDERRLIAEYIRHDALLSLYFEPFLFEELPAQDKSAETAYLEQASKSEIYLILIGAQYGYQDAEGISPTEREYDTATAQMLLFSHLHALAIWISSRWGQARQTSSNGATRPDYARRSLSKTRTF
ncbi:MAG: DUF4062 domain-containing protein [Paludibacteraceae bacterium]|nr:DUF4062 domain-containing protein [Paludibacteraceae bacterium]